MFISSASFYQMHALSQTKPIIIDAKKNYDVTAIDDSITQKIYSYAKWVFPMTITYGFSKALGFNISTTMSLVTIHLTGSALNHLSYMGESQNIQMTCYTLSWIFPIFISFTFAQALQWNMRTKIALLALHSTYSSLQFVLTVKILPAATPFRSIETDRKARIRKNKMSLLFENFLNSYQKEHDPLKSLSQKDQLEQFKGENWQTLWFSLEIDEIKLDGILIGKDPHQTKRWLTLFSGNKRFWETLDDTRDMLNAFDANGLFFNYPGVRDSSGSVNTKTLKKASETIMNFLEDPNGIGAKEIVAYGFSIGGGVLSEGLKEHRFKEGIKYLIIKDRTFASISQLISSLVKKWLHDWVRKDSIFASMIKSIASVLAWLSALAIRALGWELECVDSSKKVKTPEMIIQTVEKKEDLESIIFDDAIPKKASLMYQLKKQGIEESKYFVPVTQRHCAPLDWQIISLKFQEIIQNKWNPS